MNNSILHLVQLNKLTTYSKLGTGIKSQLALHLTMSKTALTQKLYTCVPDELQKKR